MKETKARAVRALLADDHRVVLDGLGSFLDKQSDIEVVGQVNDGCEAIRQASELNPDVVVIDIGMPGLNGIEATRQIKAQNPTVKVLCLSMHSDRDTVRAMLHAGAAGYLLKEDAAEVVAEAIHTIMDGRSFLSPGLATSVVELVREGAEERSPFSLLTGREREVLQLIAEGHSSGRIASLLEISGRTVGTHRERLKRKLGIKSIAGLTRYALQHGLTTLE